VTVYTGVRTEAQIQDDSRTPPLPVPTVYTGQFTRWDVNTVTAQRTTNLGAQVRGGRFGRSLGLPVDPATPNTTMPLLVPDGHRPVHVDRPGLRRKPVDGRVGRGVQDTTGGRPGELFETVDPTCEGESLDKPLGYVRSTPA
jgi:hypothetical protein